jgi:hypothetical protein
MDATGVYREASGQKRQTAAVTPQAKHSKYRKACVFELEM